MKDKTPKPCLVCEIYHGFYGDLFEIGHNDQLFEESSIGNLILTSCNEHVVINYTCMQKMKKIDNFEKNTFCDIFGAYNIQNSLSRLDATAKLYSFYYFISTDI